MHQCIIPCYLTDMEHFNTRTTEIMSMNKPWKMCAVMWIASYCTKKRNSHAVVRQYLVKTCRKCIKTVIKVSWISDGSVVHELVQLNELNEFTILKWTSSFVHWMNYLRMNSVNMMNWWLNEDSDLHSDRDIYNFFFLVKNSKLTISFILKEFRIRDFRF